MNRDCLEHGRERPEMCLEERERVMKNRLVQLFMEDWNGQVYKDLAHTRELALEVLRHDKYPGVRVCPYNVPLRFNQQPDNIQLIVNEAEEVATLYLVSKPRETK